MSATTTKLVTLRAKPGLDRQMKAAAKRRGWSKNQAYNAAAELWLAQENGAANG